MPMILADATFPHGLAGKEFAEPRIILGRLRKSIHEGIPALLIQLEHPAIGERVHRRVETGVEQEFAEGLVRNSSGLL